MESDILDSVLPTFVIKCTKVPAEFFKDRNIAKKYFRHFGKVKLIMFKPKISTCLVEYFDEESMKNALEIAGEFNGHIFYVCRDTTAVLRKKKIKREPDPDWVSGDAEVLSEVEAMSGIGIAKKYNLRPEAMIVDPTNELKQDSTSSKLRRNWKITKGLIKSKKSSDVKLSAEQLDLINIVKCQAFTIEDKYRILDARDKLIRLKLKRCVELSKTEATVGICPDMCPEKERLMRETQHQVSIYEQDDGGINRAKMNPKLAIKQYSRSSADQEAPLPQDLRPVHVLKMTMCYLMHNIMNLLCDDDDDGGVSGGGGGGGGVRSNNTDVNISEWYHFLWDRTRGIRKDITQQELCCQGSVELVEQCARFHILCSARLVNEDPSVFDQKINTENLTKCLQTLKYMYQDLDLKNEKCPNEAEFRAYIILLNLNDGNFMWEVQQLRPEIQHSKQVGFALDVYSALDKNNYVKFFKLVKSTTYLNACILMRYFIQVRISALKTFIKCYSPRNQQSFIPIADLMNILAFENYEATIEFLQYYGLTTNLERTHIVLDKMNFHQPDYQFVLDRAINLVESKRQSLTVGQVVYGNRQLPDKVYENHLPQNSFDTNGFLMLQLYFDDRDFSITREISAVGAPMPPPSSSSSSSSLIFEPKRPLPPPLPSPPPPPPSLLPPPEKPLIFEPPPECEKKPFFDLEKTFSPLPQHKTEYLFFDKQQQSQEVETVVGGGESQMSEFNKFKSSSKIDQLAQLIKREEQLKKLEVLKRQLEEKQKQIELENEQRKQQLEEKKRIQDEYLKFVEIKKDVEKLLTNLLNQVEGNLRKEQLSEICMKIRNRKLSEMLRKWLANTNRNKRKRKSMEFSPIMFCTRTINDECKQLETANQFLTLTDRKRYKSGLPLEVAVKQCETISTPAINLFDLTFSLLTKRYLELNQQLPIAIYWKLTISLPSRKEFKFGLNHIEQILNDYLQWTRQHDGTICLLKQYKQSSSQTVTYCIERQKGLVKTRKTDSNGFIFIANDLNDDLLTRIVANLRNFGVFVKIPIVLILQNYNENKSKLKMLIDEGIVSNYIIIVDDFSHLPTILDEALMFLANNKEKLPPPLEMDTFNSFLRRFLLGEMWRRANSFAKWNTNYKKCLNNANICIRLYNQAVIRLRKIILDPALMEYAKFPDIFRPFLPEKPEFLPCDYKFFPAFWSDATYLNRIESILNQLELPEIQKWPTTTTNLQAIIQDYCVANFQHSPLQLCYKLLGVLLKNVESVLWTDLVEILATEKINQVDFSTKDDFNSVFNQLVVVYDRNVCLKDYLNDWFYLSNPMIKAEILEMSLKENEKFVVVEHAGDNQLPPSEISVNIDDLWSKLNTSSIRPDHFAHMSKELADCKCLMNDLESTIKIEKRIFHTSGEFLKNVIQDN